MSNSSESENVNYSDSEEVFSKANRLRRKKYVPNFRLIKGFESDRETKEFQSVESDLNDVITTDGIMKAPPTVQVTSPETENLPEYKRKPSHYEAESSKEEDFSPSPVEQIFNTRALSKHSLTYELEKFEKNAMIIFNQENVDGYEKRLGTEKDVEALERTFKKYGFEVEERKDRTKAELFSELEAFANTDFTDYGCVVVAVLTHGSRQGLLRARDQPFCELELVKHFLHKPFLVTKPIIFIIQACRGTKSTAGVAVHYAGRVRKDIDEEVEAYTLPVEADILILHSSYIGKPSHRNELYGSWFIQSLCGKIDDMADSHDLEAILTEVKREVAIDRYHKEYNRRTLEMDINKQMPVTTSTLIRKLYLKKYGEETVYYRRVKNVRQSSRNEVLDSGGPITPTLMQYTTCSCFLSHFDYIKTCLRLFIEENPDDATARGFLNVADTFKDDKEFNSSKEVMLRTICSHLVTNAQEYKFFKYLHMYKK
ncbi:caspase-1-like [Choristoneura fumiferana]|uniref:caspase-1-like n=1 Tax=Choristoneura fumiferana TaxID=7141 RepID=UPI003D156284